MPRVISGGQTGADQGALRAARSAGIPTGGWAPRGWQTEDGPAPWLADWGLRECDEDGYPARTERNVRDSDVTVWLGPGGSDGYWSTRRAAERLDKPFWEVWTTGTSIQSPEDFLVFLRRDRVRVVNCAGSRESKQRGIGDRVERFLLDVFRAKESSP